MGDRTTIEWTEASWNPVRGCSIVSPGCTNCYAMRQAHRHAGAGGAYAHLTKMTKGGPVWTGRVRMVPDAYDAPLRWKKPRRIFVNSMSDLFHEGIDFEHIAALFGVMASAPQHTFQILTKRPQRAREFFEWIGNDADGPANGCILHAREILGIRRYGLRREPDEEPPWPLSNVWIGVSVEDQKRADERIPLLLQTPAAVRWISAEPLLGPVDLCETFGMWWNSTMRCYEGTGSAFNRGVGMGGLDWVVVGGESGPGARPFDIAWARSLRDQCKVAGVPFFLKQLGSVQKDGDQYRSPADYLRNRKGGDMAEFPEDLRVREYPC